MGDREQPRARIAHLLATTQRAPGAHASLLDGVLARLARDASTMREQQRAVTLDDYLKRPLITGARELNQARVARAAQQQPSREACARPNRVARVAIVNAAERVVVTAARRRLLRQRRTRAGQHMDIQHHTPGRWPACGHVFDGA